MTNIVTYQAHITHGFKAPPWLGYVVLPDGSLWGVRFEGDSEEAVRAKAVALYEKEKDKWNKVDTPIIESDGKPYEASGRGAHLRGTVCMIHHAMKKRIRCTAAEIAKFEADGWQRGGPRTQFND